MTHDAGGLGAPAPEKGMGWYVYAILPWSVQVDVPAGIAVERFLVFIPEGPIMAAAIRVSLEVFDAEPLRRHMEDPHWLAEKVCQHEAVVEAMVAGRPVLPMKFCTIFRSPDAVRRMLREHAAQFEEALEFVREKEEWGVKGFAHRDCLRKAALRRDPELCEMAERLSTSARARPGSAFFLKRRMDDLAEQRRKEREIELVQEAVEALWPSVVQLAINSPLRIRGHGTDPAASAAGGEPAEEMVLNLACLVLRQEVHTLLDEVRRWNEARVDQGVRLLASGPWPPYNFSPRLGDHAR